MQHFVVEANTSATWQSGASGRGFVETKPRRRVCGGLTKVLRKRIKAGKNRSVMTIARHQPDWRIMPSNRALGARVHRHLMHTLLCTPLGHCTCGKSASNHAPTHFMSVCQQAAKRFIAEHHLRPVAAELVVLDAHLPIGTRFDAMFRDTRTNKLVLVSWKTGIGCTDECEWTRAKTQVAWEWMTMERWRRPGDEHISAAYVVYLGGATVRSTRQSIGFYAENRISREHAAALYASLMAKVTKKK